MMVAQRKEPPVTTPEGKPTNLTDATFDEFVSKFDVAIIDCWAPWCGPCRMLSPIIEEIAREMNGKIGVGKLNTDESSGIPQRYQVMSIPTTLIFKKGKLEDKIVGAVPKKTLVGRLQGLIAA
jgi:thioredoxin 1